MSSISGLVTILCGRSARQVRNGMVGLIVAVWVSDSGTVRMLLEVQGGELVYGSAGDWTLLPLPTPADLLREFRGQ